MKIELVHEIIEHAFDGNIERYAIKRDGIHQNGFYVRNEGEREEKLKEATDAFNKYKELEGQEEKAKQQEIILSEEILSPQS